MSETKESAATLMKLQFWLYRYWRWILLLIVLIVVGMVGISYFNHMKQMRLTDALYTYQTEFETVSEKNLESAQVFAKEDLNLYTTLTHLEIANLYAKEGNYVDAAAQLNQALQKEQDPFLSDMVYFRVARLQFELNEYTQSLISLNSITDPSWLPLINNLKGDIYVQMKNYALAKQAYEQALTDHAVTTFNGLIEMKLNQVDKWIEAQ